MTRRRDRGVTVGDAAPAPTHGPAGAGIVLDHVQKHFFHNGRPVVALRDVSLSVTAGEFVSVIGPSGCGKSTLLRIIGGLIAPDGGSVRIDDATPGRGPGREALRSRATDPGATPVAVGRRERDAAP